MTLLQRAPNRFMHLGYSDKNVLPVFRNPQQAKGFLEKLWHLDTRSFRWVVSLERNTNECVFQTRVRRDDESLCRIWGIEPVPFDFTMVDALLERDIGCVMVDEFQLQNDVLTINGVLWNP